MNLKIWHKLALILLTMMTLSVVIGVGLSQRSFKSGFLDYLYQQHQHRLSVLGNQLIANYEENGNWDFIRANRRLWRFYLRPKPRSFHPQRGGSVKEKQQRVYPASGNAHPSEFSFLRPEKNIGFKRKPPKMALLDPDKQLIVGRAGPQENSHYYPLKSNGQIIAYIQSEKFSGITDQLDQMFAAKQSRAFFINTILSLILSVSVALLVSLFFRRRINALTHVAQQLTSGQYHQRVIIKQKDELGQLGEDFNALAETLQKNQQSQQQWIADISHELRTPVAILKGEIEALEEGIRPLNKRAIQSLKQEIERLSKLINDLYQLSISDMGALKYEKQPFVLNDLIDELIEHFEPRFTKQGLSLTLDNSISEQCIFKADRQRLYQLLSNLLENSLRYTNPGGRVLLHCHENDKQITLSVEDSAPGISADKLSNIFDRLFRLENSRSRSHGGAGLGLAIVRQIVLAHQGHVTAAPSELGGLLITCVLPK